MRRDRYALTSPTRGGFWPRESVLKILKAVASEGAFGSAQRKFTKPRRHGGSVRKVATRGSIARSSRDATATALKMESRDGPSTRRRSASACTKALEYRRANMKRRNCQNSADTSRRLIEAASVISLSASGFWP